MSSSSSSVASTSSRSVLDEIERAVEARLNSLPIPHPPEEPDLEEIEESFQFDEEEILMDDTLDAVIVITNLPDIPLKKADKLKTLLVKLLSPVEKVDPDRIHFLFEHDETFARVAFVELSHPDAAIHAQEKLSNYQLDKNHTLSTFFLSEVEDMLHHESDGDSEFIPRPFLEPSNLYSWLLDERGRSQYVKRFGESTEVIWFDSTQKSTEAFRQNRFTDRDVHWSNDGKYLITEHAKGIRIAAGDNFSDFKKLVHPQVKVSAFSNTDAFVVSYSQVPLEDKNTLFVWDTTSGRMLRGFPIVVQPHQWPALRWSPKDDYFARIDPPSGDAPQSLAIYETSTFRLLRGKKLFMDRLVDFSWSPTRNWIAYWERDEGVRPAKITILDVETLTEVRSKTIFNLLWACFEWSDDGRFLSVIVKQAKSKTQKAMHIELFRLSEKNIPVEVVNIENDEDIIHLAWEPCGGPRCAVIHGTLAEPRNPQQSLSAAQQLASGGPMQKPFSVTILHMGSKKNKHVKVMDVLRDCRCSHIKWSPRGRFLVLAALKLFRGELQFYDSHERITLANREHFMISDIEWDPTGRYVTTQTSYRKTQLHNGFNIWTFYGEVVEQSKIDHFWQFLWRPRPKTLLPHDKEEEIRSKLSEKIERYKKEDEALLVSLSQDEVDRRQTMYSEYMEWFDIWNRYHEEEREARWALQGYCSDEEQEMVEEVEYIEEMVSERTEVEV